LQQKMRRFALAMVSVSVLALAGEASAALPSGNLVVNGDAEADLGATDLTTTATPSGWTERPDGYDDAISTVEYGASGPFPDTAVSDEINGGDNFFFGGVDINQPDSGHWQVGMTQEIDLSPWATEIDAGGVEVNLSAYLGGTGTNRDSAAVIAGFADANDNPIDTFILQTTPYVSPAVRNNQTTLVKTEDSGFLPVGTRTAFVGVDFHNDNFMELDPENDDAYAEGYADNIRLTLGDEDEADSDGDGVPDSTDQCPDTPGPASNDGCPDGTDDYLESEVWQTEEGSEQDVMPKVVGKDIDEARDLVTAAFTNASFDLQFTSKCGDASPLEVTKQIPKPGQAVVTSVSDAVLAKLRVCTGGSDFLSDCHIPSLNKDLRALKGEIDGALGLEISRLSDCPVDFDAQITSEFGEDAALGTQGKKKKGQIKVAVDCPAESDLSASIGEGFSGSDALTFGLRINGEEDELWALPYPHGGTGASAYKSYLSITVADLAGQWPETTALVDDDEVNPQSKKTDLYKSRDGVITIPVTAERGGTIRICVFQETAGAELLTKSYEVEVVEAPQGGSNEIYATAGGRYIRFAGDGPEEIDPDEAVRRDPSLRSTPTAASARRFDFLGCLANIWTCFSDLMNGRSQTVNSAEGSSDSDEKKYSTTRKTAKIGVAQVSMSSDLQADPSQPEVQLQACLLVWQSSYYGTKCPVITAPGGAAIVGASNGGAAGLMATGASVLSHNGGQLVPKGQGQLVGADASSLIGTDGSSLVGTDASSLIGLDGSSLAAVDGLDGSNGVLIAGGPNAIRPATADLQNAGGMELIGFDGSSRAGGSPGLRGASSIFVPADAILGQQASGLVPENGLP
jgi:hypothetical protein